MRLASQLTGWDIDILTEDEESDRRTEAFHRHSQMFIDALNIDDVIAHLLVAEGYTTVEEVAFVPIEEISSIEGFSEEVAGELRERGRSHLAERDRELSERRQEIGVSDDLAAVAGLTPTMLVALGEQGIKTLDNLADLASDELIEMLPEIMMNEDEANAIIMAARAHWFDDEDTPSETAGEAAGDDPDADADAEPAEAETQTVADAES